MILQGHTGVKCPFFCPMSQMHSHSGADTVQNSELHHSHTWSRVRSSCLPGPTLLCFPCILGPQRFRATGLHSVGKRGSRGKGLSSGQNVRRPPGSWPGLNDSKMWLGLSDWGHLDGSVVEHLPSAQVVIPGSWDGPPVGSLFVPLPVSLPLSLRPS